MFSEYAIDPESFSTWERLRFFHAALGFVNGRLVTRLPESFLRAPCEALLTSVNDAKMPQVQMMLEEIKDASIARLKPKWNEGAPWIANALNEHQRRPFRAVVGPGAAGKPFLVDPEDLHANHVLWRASSTMKVPKDPKALAQHLLPMLSQANELTIADPYLRANDRWLPTLGAILLGFLDKRAPDPARRVHFYFAKKGTGKESDPSETLDTIAATLAKALEGWKRQATLIFHGIASGGSERFHNRYILTAREGVSLHIGMDAARNSDDRDLLTVLSREVFDEEYTLLQRLARRRGSTNLTLDLEP
ncbi:hypothetical protein [Holophaga foetida]|uniref:hypothetical protein n=1 Tax=Holophaga foetida TaxID=35839 RepID=UPI000247373F|nr:hypothetical protein [Holophaga foetida]